MKKKLQILKIKKVQGLLAILCFVGLAVAGIVIGLDTIKEKEVSAHPTNTIKLDEGGANEFEVPVDGTKLEEQTLKDLTPQFDDYVQGEELVPSASKSNVVSYGSDSVNNVGINWSVSDIRRTTYGNYLVLFRVTGSNTGGLLKLSVFNDEGIEISTETIGSLVSSDLRVTTGLYEAENNNYLIGTGLDDFYRCTVENETSSSAQIELTKLSTIEASRQKLQVHLLKKVTTNQRINNKPLVTGLSLYMNYPDGQREGIIKGRIPFGTLDKQNWLVGNMTADVDHEYSLENIKSDEFFSSTDQVVIDNNEIYMNDAGIIVGSFNYTESKKGVYQTIQIFSQDEVTIDGNNLKKREFSYYDNNDIGSKAQILWDICTDDKVYFTWRIPNETQLIEVDLNTFQSTIRRRYPKDTRLLMIRNDDGDISYYGSTTRLEGEFYSKYYTNSLNSPYYYIQGIMRGVETTEPGEVKNIRAMEISNWVLPYHVMNIDANNFLIGGTTYDTSSFPDTALTILEDGQVVERTPKTQSAFIGLITLADDWSPTIKKATNISVDLDDPAIQTPSSAGYRDWNTLDRWLITGSKNGVVSDVDAIKVYDHFDSNDSLIGATPQAREEWLQKRINRNPNTLAAAIEWEKLGFDKSTAGAKLVTYFVADTQGQPVTTSRWVNKKTGQTEEDDDYAIDAQNFHIPLTDIDTAIPDANKFKELAKTMAWNKASSDTDEDGTDPSKLSSKVTVDANQLKALREAKTAKPYPVDVTYKPKLGVEITNRVWVFVTTKNTIPNSETNPEITPQDTNGVVYYADDYTMPLYLGRTCTASDVITRGNVRVYDYFDADHETDSELPTLADATKNANKLVVENLTVLNDAMQPGTVTPTIRYEWDGTIDGNHADGSVSGNETRGSLDVKLTGDTLLHVRQVILNDSDELVVPKKGYMTIRHNLFNSGAPAFDSDYQSQVVISSGKETDNPSFTKLVLSTSELTDEQDEVWFKPIIPEFYQYVGHYVSFEMTDPQGASHTGNLNHYPNDPSLIRGIMDFEGEFWLSIYLKPTENDQGETKAPQPYSWDYEKNDLGKIKTK